MEMKEEQIIEIIKSEAHKNLTIVDEGNDLYNDYVIKGVDLMAKSLVKLFTIPDIVSKSKKLKPNKMKTKMIEKEKATESHTLLSNGGVCKITNGKLSWVLQVDGKKIHFNGSDNADYFAEVYTKLGYTIEWDKDKWERD